MFLFGTSWMVWGLHVGWNYVQSSILGVTVSGASDFDSWLVATVSGPQWLTGGSFGIEASYVTTVIYDIGGGR